jgi:tetratricopeptide (TPR) repeat protein
MAANLHQIGLALLSLGAPTEAERAFRACLGLQEPADHEKVQDRLLVFAQARRELAKTLRQKGKPDGPTALEVKRLLDEAAAEYREATRLWKNEPEFHCKLGFALEENGLPEKATAEYREALRLTDEPHKAGMLGIALREEGKFRLAAEAYRRGLEITRGGYDPFFSSRCQENERLADLEPRLPRLLRGEERPAGGEECLALAQFCQEHKKQFAAAAHWYREAFAARPALADELTYRRRRFQAACAAALAGCGKGEDAATLDEQARAQLRRQALDWLRAELGALRLLDRPPDWVNPPPINLDQEMRFWLTDYDLAGVRAPAGLEKLPPAERSTWQHFWEEVEAVPRRAGGG